MSKIQWAGYEDNLWEPVGGTLPKINPGVYKINPSPFSNWTLSAIKPKHDTIIETGLVSEVFSTIQKFWASREQYHKFGFLHKRGVLMIGSPGIGKSMTAMCLCHKVAAHGGIAVMAQPQHPFAGMVTSCLRGIREAEPVLPILNLMEDIERFLKQTSGMSSLTSLLDGETQIDNVVHVATTNIPDKLDARFLNRPGRFDDVIYVTAPTPEVRRAYLMAVLPPEVLKDIAHASQIDKLVEASDGLLLSHMKELIASVFVLGRTPESAVASLREMIAKGGTACKYNEEEEEDEP